MNTVTNKWKKLIKSLHSKKHRKNNGLFLVEGEKSFFELVKSELVIKYAIVSDLTKEGIADSVNPLVEIVEAPPSEINGLSTLANNYSALAVVEIPEMQIPNPQSLGNLTLMLDGIKDPGNLGTIVRTADWYGIKNILCSTDCADFYNSKVISATMGSFTRLRPVYVELEDFLELLSSAIEGDKTQNIFGAFMDGESVHQISNLAQRSSILIMGNESNGISDSLVPYLTDKISIPGAGTAESLNVAMATSILCDNLVRLSK